ncbi:hypothetical protein LTR17_003012 [Elasticomyces elasticus]|nr:hypothetical protein LTR17_003012 [Elasticomyces elasticus]
MQKGFEIARDGDTTRLWLVEVMAWAVKDRGEHELDVFYLAPILDKLEQVMEMLKDSVEAWVVLTPLPQELIDMKNPLRARRVMRQGNAVVE